MSENYGEKLSKVLRKMLNVSAVNHECKMTMPLIIVTVCVFALWKYLYSLAYLTTQNK